MVDFQALVGDAVDNIPGVPLVGPKVAREWLEKFGSLDELLLHAGELPSGKRKQNLLDSGQRVLDSRRLVELERHVPMAIDWQAARVGGRGDARQLAELCASLAFVAWPKSSSAGGARASQMARFRPRRAVEKHAPAAAVRRRQRPPASPPRRTGRSTITPSTRRKNWPISSRSSDNSRRSPSIPRRRIIWPIGPKWSAVRFAGRPARLTTCRYGRRPASRIWIRGAALEALREVLENPAVKKVGQNLKYDMIVLRSAGIKLAGAEFDTMIASYLLDAGERITTSTNCRSAI